MFGVVGSWVGRCRLLCGVWLAGLAIGALPFLIAPAEAGALSPPQSFLTVMTRNMDEGTDFGYITAAAGNPALLGPAVVQTYCEVVASQPEQRAARIADEIAAAQPDVVSLQEVAEWASFVTLPCGGPGTIDAKSALLNRLAADGAGYHVVTQLDEFNSASIPGLPVSFLDRDVLLARNEPVTQLTLANVQAQHFSTLLTLPLAPGLNVTILRGWMSVDATVRGNTARVIATHLESFFEPVQEAQAAELATGPAATSLPVILAGDLNTGPGSLQTASYNFLTQTAGFSDTWAVTQPGDPGYTDSFYTEDPLTPSTPSERIDLILVHGATVPSAPKDYLVGTEIPHPSDHAGVVAKVTIP
jgi:endonuclease/exonuclease/phosphatase family metal-dependent hydrolase